MRRARRALPLVQTLLALPMLLVVPLLPGCEVGAAPDEVRVPADSAAGEVAFELAGPNEAALLVPVRINGQGPFQFVLDTGATLTCVDQALAESLALPEAAGIARGAGIASSGQVRLLEIDSMAVGAARAFDMTVCEIDLSSMQALGLELSGLVGLNFLKSFRVTLDFERNVLHLR